MQPIPTGKICVSIPGATISESIATAAKAAADADVVEIRLDGLDRIEIQPFIDALKKPLLFTNRANWEGGSFKGSEEQRLQALHEAVALQAAYIDIELKTDDALKLPLISQAKAKGTASIVSWHSFVDTPSSNGLLSILQEQYRSGADIGKIVTMASNYQDVLRVLNLQITADEIGFPLMAFCMGDAGTMSRVATLTLGGYMTYAAASEAEETAPGQITATRMRTILREIYGDH